jgi:hypothetical protein
VLVPLTNIEAYIPYIDQPNQALVMRRTVSWKSIIDKVLTRILEQLITFYSTNTAKTIKLISRMTTFCGIKTFKIFKKAIK